jgi:hypothetical protein
MVSCDQALVTTVAARANAAISPFLVVMVLS